MTLTPSLHGQAGTLLVPPLTDYESRYPSDDDEPMADTEEQYYAIIRAVFALSLHLERTGRGGTVRGNCALYGNPDNLTHYLAPDVLLAYDVAVPSKGGYAPWEFGKPPDLVMEMASPTTHDQDSGRKRVQYAALGIAEYWQYDPHHKYLETDLLGWQLQGHVYVPITLTEDPARGAQVGYSRVLDTDWGLEQETGTLRLWNTAAQAWYPTEKESETGRQRAEAAWFQAEARAEAAETRAETAELRVQQAEAEITRLRSLLYGTQKDDTTPED